MQTDAVRGERREGGRGAEKGKGAMFSLRSNISCEEGSTSWAGGEGRGGEGSRGGGHQVRAFLKVVIHIWIILIYNFSV